MVKEHFVPVKFHIKDNPSGFERFGVQWTPTVMIADPDGTERYRFEGYLPPEDFLA
jgi:thioredoxin-related protein